jgi:hypothetical protein
MQSAWSDLDIQLQQQSHQHRAQLQQQTNSSLQVLAKQQLEAFLKLTNQQSASCVQAGKDSVNAIVDNTRSHVPPSLTGPSQQGGHSRAGHLVAERLPDRAGRYDLSR